MFNNSINQNNKIDNREITLKMFPLKNSENMIYTFIWWSDGKRQEFISHRDDKTGALEEFRGVYPHSKGCIINEVVAERHN